MKKLFLLLFVLALPLLASAQIRFGYFSYDTVLKSMPDYLMAQRNIDDLRQKYDNEMKRSEQEFNAKYEEFLDAQYAARGVEHGQVALLYGAQSLGRCCVASEYYEMATH